MRNEVMRPSCTNGTNGASGSIVASRIRCSGAGGRGMSMINSLVATRVPSANTRAASSGGR